MYLPSLAAISLLLFISADSAGAFLIIHPKNSTNISGNGNSSHVLMLKAGGDSTLAHNKPAERTIERPSNINGCTRQRGVRATCITVGKRSDGDRRVFKKSIFKYGKTNDQRHDKVAFSIKSGLRKKGYVVSYIKVTNKMKLGREGLVSLVKGGVLDKEVVLFMESQKGKKMHFHVEIYANHADKAYKTQLGSLISSLKEYV